MSTAGYPVDNAGIYCYSHALKRVISSLTDYAVVQVDTGHNGPCFGTREEDAEKLDSDVLTHFPTRDTGAVVSFQQVPIEDFDRHLLEGGKSDAGSEDPATDWTAFECVFENGTRDRVALKIERDQDLVFVQQFLERIWPILREDCLTEVRAGLAPPDDEALLWMISDRIDVAVLVLDGRSRIRRVNVAAKELLDAKGFLRRRIGGLFCANEADSRQLREAVARCAHNPDPKDAEDIVFLESETDGHKVPVTLSRFFHKGEPTRYVVAMLPTPPDRKRIEMLVRRMGLSSSEARVAALMQLGLTNREAAKEAGLKEQTFNTYAKRVMGKLNVRGRTEMAQLLTWQAAGRNPK